VSCGGCMCGAGGSQVEAPGQVYKDSWVPPWNGLGVGSMES